MRYVSLFVKMSENVVAPYGKLSKDKDNKDLHLVPK